MSPIQKGALLSKITSEELLMPLAETKQYTIRKWYLKPVQYVPLVANRNTLSVLMT